MFVYSSKLAFPYVRPDYSCFLRLLCCIDAIETGLKAPSQPKCATSASALSTSTFELQIPVSPAEFDMTVANTDLHTLQANGHDRR